MKLLSQGAANTKLAKGAGLHDRYLNYILHLAPAKLSGYNVCPKASTGCAAACLNSAGRGAFSNVQNARIRKTKQLFENKEQFLNDLVGDLERVQRKARKLGKTAVVRLNGTSDIAWEKIKVRYGVNVFDNFPDIQFYDYTKIAARAVSSKTSPFWPRNYHLTFSASESNHAEAWQALDAGVNVAIVFDKLPKAFGDIPVIDGDAHDFRFLDGQGVIVGLTAKGKAKKDTSGFVLRVPTSELASAPRTKSLTSAPRSQSTQTLPIAARR